MLLGRKMRVRYHSLLAAFMDNNLSHDSETAGHVAGSQSQLAAMFGPLSQHRRSLNRERVRNATKSGARTGAGTVILLGMRHALVLVLLVGCRNSADTGVAPQGSPLASAQSTATSATPAAPPATSATPAALGPIEPYAKKKGIVFRVQVIGKCRHSLGSVSRRVPRVVSVLLYAEMRSSVPLETGCAKARSALKPPPISVSRNASLPLVSCWPWPFPSCLGAWPGRNIVYTLYSRCGNDRRG
jgi:hypothetical protein